MTYFIVNAALIISFLTVAAYATTDMLRLLKNSTRSVTQADCLCPACDSRILLRDQIPIFSYLLRRGRCRSCHAKIPAGELRLEFWLFFSFSVLFALLGPCPLFFVCAISLYEATKALLIAVCGRRAVRFWRELLLSLRNNVFIFSLFGVILFFRYLITYAG